jgi:hypothetical protein
MQDLRYKDYGIELTASSITTLRGVISLKGLSRVGCEFGDEASDRSASEGKRRGRVTLWAFGGCILFIVLHFWKPEVNWLVDGRTPYTGEQWQQQVYASWPL